jgi:hypothetical protein
VLFMNEHEVEEVFDRLDGAYPAVPNLATGASVLDALVAWTNEHSDGWPYWPKPARAAKNLMELFRERDYAIRFGHDQSGNPLTDVDAADLTKALRPIKTFLTTQGVNWNADLPWAALLPAA